MNRITRNLIGAYKDQNDVETDRTDISASLSKKHLQSEKMVFLLRRWLLES